MGQGQAQAEAGWLGFTSLGMRRSFLSLNAGITLWGDVNFLPYEQAAIGLFVCKRRRRTPPTTTFKAFEISHLEITCFLF